MKREKPKKPRKPNDGGVKKPAAPSPPANAKEWQEGYHAHLDKCAQCRNHPFNLCPVGAKLLTTVPPL